MRRNPFDDRRLIASILAAESDYGRPGLPRRPEWRDGGTCTTMSTDQVPTFAELRKTIERLKVKRPKVDCFLMLHATAHRFLKQMTVRTDTNPALSDSSALMGLPLHIAWSISEYFKILRSLKRRDLLVGVIESDVPLFYRVGSTFQWIDK